MAALDDLVREGRALMAEERRLILAGDVRTAAGLAEAKASVARGLAELAADPPPVADRAGLARLIEEAKGNERLLAAAREGVRAARRRIEAIAAARSGVVAYGRDGLPVVSREDAAGATKRA